MKSVEEEIQEQYDFVQKIGTGSFGHIISVKSKNDNKIYACKIQKSHGKKTILVEKEFLIMAQLTSSVYFPQVYTFKKLNENSYIIMQKLDHNLQQLFVERNKKFTLQTIALIANQMFSALRMLHEFGYLHRDLKPQNMMIRKNCHSVKIIDFGLADGLKVRRATTLIGNVRFSSRSSHYGCSSKKQDLQSLIFILFYFLSGSLPWQNCSKQEIQMQINRRNDLGSHPQTPILKLKTMFLQIISFPTTKNQIKKAFYDQFYKLTEYIYKLGTSDQPDYRWIDNRCQRLQLLAGTRNGKCYDWCQPDCSLGSQSDLWQIFN